MRKENKMPTKKNVIFGEINAYIRDETTGEFIEIGEIKNLTLNQPKENKYILVGFDDYVKMIDNE